MLNVINEPPPTLATVIGPQGVLYERVDFRIEYTNKIEETNSFGGYKYTAHPVFGGSFETSERRYMDTPIGTDLKVIQHGTTGSIPLDLEPLMDKSKQRNRFYAQMGEYKDQKYGYVRDNQMYITAVWCTGPEIGDMWEETIVQFARADDIEAICKLGIDYSRDRRAIERLSGQRLEIDGLPPGPDCELGRYVVPVDYGQFVIGTRAVRRGLVGGGAVISVYGQFRGSPPKFLLPPGLEYVGKGP